jgi:hypothetical protein
MDNQNINSTVKNKATKTSVILGIVYGLVAAGFYVTPYMFFLLGLASLSTVASMQDILTKNFGWLFLLLGGLLTLTTIMVYLEIQHVKKLTLAEIKPHRFIADLRHLNHDCLIHL